MVTYFLLSAVVFSTTLKSPDLKSNPSMAPVFTLLPGVNAFVSPEPPV